jgi:hypothetical protein
MSLRASRGATRKEAHCIGPPRQREWESNTSAQRQRYATDHSPLSCGIQAARLPLLSLSTPQLMDPWASPWAEEDAPASSAPVQTPPPAQSSSPTASPPPRAATPDIDPWAVPATPRAPGAETSAATSQRSTTEGRSAQPWSSGWRAESEEPAAAPAFPTSHSSDAQQEVPEALSRAVDDTADPWADPVRHTAPAPSHTSASEGWRSEPVEEGWHPTEHAAVTWGGTGGIGLVAQSAGIDSLNERKASWSASTAADSPYAGEPQTDIDAAFSARLRGPQRSASSSAANAPEQSSEP